MDIGSFASIITTHSTKGKLVFMLKSGQYCTKIRDGAAHISDNPIQSVGYGYYLQPHNKKHAFERTVKKSNTTTRTNVHRLDILTPSKGGPEVGRAGKSSTKGDGSRASLCLYHIPWEDYCQGFLETFLPIFTIHYKTNQCKAEGLATRRFLHPLGHKFLQQGVGRIAFRRVDPAGSPLL